MSRDDELITQSSLSTALLSFILLMLNQHPLDRALVHSFLVFILSYSFIYASYVLYQRIKTRLHRMEVEEQKRRTLDEKSQRQSEQPRSAAERIGLGT